MLSHTFIISVAALVALTIVSAAALHAWNSWLALRGREMEHYGPGADAQLMTCNHPLARIEIADLRERIRKLEDIAAGIDV